MSYFYGDIPRSNGLTRAMDMEYMDRRWQAMVDADFALVVVEGSVVSLTPEQRLALDTHTAAWRYDIGQFRIECLFERDWIGEDEFNKTGLFHFAE